MANGDDALEAGMDIVSGDDDRRNGYDEINKTRDYIAQRTSAVQPVSKGGTGATGAAQARVNLGAAATNHTHESSQVDYSGIGSASSPPNVYRAVDGSLRLTGWTPSDPGISQSAADGRYLRQAGGTVSGNTYFPNASPATSGYAVAYINGDGRLSRNASSERYKKFISSIDPASLGDVWPDLVRYQMRGGDGTWKYGYIAERLDESDDLRPFVVYDVDGQPDSIDFIMMLMVQNAQLHQAVELLTQRVEHLEADHAGN